MLMAALFTLVDGVAGTGVSLIGLLAIPPVIAAMSSSRPETGMVAGLCILLGGLSGLWNTNLGSSAYLTGMLEILAGAAVGLWVAGLRATLIRERQAAELMADAGELLEEDLDLKRRAEHLASLGTPALGDIVTVDLRGPRDSIERVACVSSQRGAAEDFVRLRERQPIAIDGPHPVAAAIRTGRIQLQDHDAEAKFDSWANEEDEKRVWRERHVSSTLVLPLRARGETLGAISFLITQPSHRFDSICLRTAQRLADRGALALDNARLHEGQSHIASVLQDSLRPRSLPKIAGFDTASRFLAAGAAYEVGGDFYDAFHTGSGVWTIVIGDVCGKGPEAAALTALARYTVRAASEPEVPPSRVLDTLHESISVEQTGLRFCTAALAQLTAPSNGRGAASVTVSLGGHPPPMIVREGGGTERVGEPGTLLGAIANPSLHDRTAELALGDSLVLYTDGMLEQREHREDDDPEGWLEDCLAEIGSRSADEIAERLAKSALKRQGGEQRDDIAIVVLRRTGEA